MESKPRNVYQKLNAIKEEVHYVQKDATVSGGGSYKAVTHDNVTAHTRQYFVKHGVMVVPRLIAGEVVDTGRKTSGGSPIIRYQGKYEVSFVNIDDPADVCLMPMEAHAEDHGDKAPGKALSYATKYATLKVLQIETGENDESRVPESEPEPLSEDEIEGLKKKLNAAKSKTELSAKLTEVFEVTKNAGDKEAHAALKAYAVTLASNLPKEARAA